MKNRPERLLEFERRNEGRILQVVPPNPQFGRFDPIEFPEKIDEGFRRLGVILEAVLSKVLMKTERTAGRGAEAYSLSPVLMAFQQFSGAQKKFSRMKALIRAGRRARAYRPKVAPAWGPMSNR